MIIVQKFGGTSVGSVERIKNVAKRVKLWHDAGHQVVVVVSAMSGETNRLLGLVNDLTGTPSLREQDIVVSSGEQVAMALLAMALQEIGVGAQSFFGWQAGIQTDNVYSKARILNINTGRILDCWQKNQVAVVAGFQGINPQNDVTTLGRGGSDTSAVALAAALHADECQIYTDVDGVYSTDPRVVPEARRVNKITFEEMLEMSSLGAKVLQIRSVELAFKQKVPLRVLSSLTEVDINNVGGTLICPETKNDEEITTMEAVTISGIAFNRDEAQIKIIGLPDKPGIAYSLLSIISDANIEVDMIVQNTSEKKITDFTFTVNRSDYKKALSLAKEKSKELGADKVVGNDGIVKVSVIGVGMRSHAGIASSMFQALAAENINILIISTSEIKISVGLNEMDLEKSVRVLHKHFALDQEVE